MKAPVKWLTEYTDLEVSGDKAIHELAEAMTISGTKVESVDKLGGEIDRVVVGKCISFERHQNSDHMFVCQMDVGEYNDGLLQIVTGAQNVRTNALIPVALDKSTIAGGVKIKSGKLRGENSFGMMCSFEEIGLSHLDYEGGIDDGIMVLQDLKMFEGLTDEQFDAFIGKDILAVLGVSENVIDFEVTSNRADCFSILGLAREAAVTMGGKYIKPEFTVKEESDAKAEDLIAVEVKDADLCPLYAARVVKNVKIGPSPKWMRERLEAAGVRAINNIVDITNYVMLEYGQPMHAFDKRTIHNDKIIVRRAADGEVIKTLDGQERTMDSSMLVIADSEGAVAIAGVMGGENSEITEETTDLIFEAAVFDAVTVRRGAKKVGLRTEASSRFEKGLDTVTCLEALERAVNLIEVLGAGDVCKGVVMSNPVEKAMPEIRFIPEKINAFLGTDATTEQMVDILTQLECKVDVAGQKVIPPSFRGDLLGEADIAEEIARFFGYNNIKSSLLGSCETTLGQRNRTQLIRDKVRTMLTGLGYNEMLSFSFESPSLCDKLNLPADSKLRDAVVITNPLGEDYSVMRTSMLPTILNTLSFNAAQRTADASVFEISYVYIKDEDETKIPEHKELVSLGKYGNCTFFDIKGEIEAVLDSLHITNYEAEAETENPSMHPGRTAKLIINGKSAGFFGQVHPIVADKFECPANSYVAMLDFAVIEKAAVDIPVSKELPKFPAVTRDLAIVVDKAVTAGSVEKIIKQRGGKVLESCKLFDCYEGAQVGEGKKSLAYSLAFRDENKTLTDDDVNKPMKKILNGLETMLGAELR
ncbi:MAG: phenylalanine--tRNA ligase subunit beta [Ruminococcaceae bacterium]|nr:phenylalanine--tRNA ligase subunit beta [Oscillospiraceae bacterium]